MIYKNTASQKIACFAYTVATGAAKTGDAANITAYISKDWAAGAAITDTNPTEADATNMPGWYYFDLTQAETNAEVLIIAPKSATSGVVVDQVQVFTQDATISSRASQTTADSILTDTGTDIPSTLTTIAGYIDTEVAAIKAKTDNLPTDPADQSAVEAAITAATSPLATAANLATLAGYVDTEVAAILADTNELQTDWANGGRLDLILDARSSQTSVDDLPTNSELATALGTADDATLAAIAALNNLSAAQVNAEVVDVLRTDTLPDSYAADGAQPTIAQAVLMVWQFLSERAVSGTTVTVKKPDGSTSAMTFTLSDTDNPTSITRAG